MSDTKKELLMRIVVVVLAFTLTVSGVVYLAKALLGDTDANPAPAPQTAQMTIPVSGAEQPAGDPMAETPQTPEAQIPVTTPPPATQVPVTTTPPAAVTPPPATTPPATTAPQVTAPRPTPPPVQTAPVQTAPVTRPPQAAPTTPTTANPAPIHVTGTYVIQFSSFRSEENAKNEARQFLETCSDMYVTKVELANGIWYRVRGCNRDTRQAAESMKAELKTKYNVDSLVVNVQ